MNILFLVPYAPTLIRTRPYNLIRTLLRRGHAITLATLWESEWERRHLEALAGEGARLVVAPLSRPRVALNLARALATGVPLQAAYCWHPALAQNLQSLISNHATRFDLIHVEHLRGAKYGLHLQSAISKQQSRIPIVWDSVDCISLLFEQAAQDSRSPFGRWITRLELPRTRRYEGFLVRQFDRVLATSAADKAALEKLAANGGPPSLVRAVSDGREGRGVSVLPNGVDFDYFTPNLGPRLPDTIVLTGKMSYHANVTAAMHLVNDIMPAVWARRPDVRVAIVGNAPPREIRTLAEQHGPRVSVSGYVPDLRPHLWSGTLAVAPVTYGAGIQNKVLEAMACATPVVATPQAASALEARAGEDLLVADSPQAFAGEMLRLLEDEGLRHRVGANGRRYVVAHHDWAVIAGDLEEIYLCLTRKLNSTSD